MDAKVKERLTKTVNSIIDRYHAKPPQKPDYVQLVTSRHKKTPRVT